MLPAGVKLYVGNTEFTSMLDVEADVVLEKEMNGGFKSLSFETDTYAAQSAIRLGQKVVLWDTTWSKGAFIGQVASVKMQGPCMQVTAGRPTRNQRFQETQVYSEGQPLTTCVLHALGQISQVYQGTVEDSGIQLVENSPEFALQTFEDVMQWAVTQSNSFLTPLIWEVESAIGSQLPLINMRYLDGGPRWVAKIPIDQLEQSFDIESQANRVAIAWGNREQYQLAPLGGIVSYQVIPVIVDKTMDASTRVSTPGRARDLADAYLAKYYAQLIDSNGQITLDCDNELMALPPLFGVTQTVVPLWLFMPGWVVRVQPTDLMTSTAPYNNLNKLAVGSSYSFKEGVLRISTGQAGGFAREVELLESYAINRLYQAQVYGELRYAVPNSDELPVYGPEFTTTPPSFRNGIPTFVITSTGEVLPYDGVVHPNLLKDEGLEMNIAVSGTSLGFKPSVKTIPGVYSTYDITLSSTANGFQTPSTAPVIELYHNPVGTTTLTQIGADLTLSASRNTGTFAPTITFAQGDRLQVKVVTVGVEAGLAISVALHGKKAFPAINVVHI